MSDRSQDCPGSNASQVEHRHDWDMMKARLATTALHACLRALCCVLIVRRPGASAQHHNISSIGAVGDGAVVCPLGHYNHDEDGSTDCLACPAGKYSLSPRAISRPQLHAGVGNLAQSVDNGDPNKIFSIGNPSSNPHPDGGWNFATTSCYFDDCIAECTCAVDCDTVSNGGIPLCRMGKPGATLYDEAGFAGMNGVRRCGATSQSSVLFVSCPPCLLPS